MVTRFVLPYKFRRHLTQVGRNEMLCKIKTLIILFHLAPSLCLKDVQQKTSEDHPVVSLKKCFCFAYIFCVP